MTNPTAKYRKRPVVIDAYQTDVHLDIETLEGTMRASPGDWIITGLRGEKYPCKPDIFDASYESAGIAVSLPPVEEIQPPRMPRLVRAHEAMATEPDVGGALQELNISIRYSAPLPGQLTSVVTVRAAGDVTYENSWRVWADEPGQPIGSSLARSVNEEIAEVVRGWSKNAEARQIRIAAAGDGLLETEGGAT